jgi:uncharacterized protein
VNDHLARRPVRDGLFDVEPLRLIGSACRTCSARTFPARAFCPACDSDDIEPAVALVSTGRLYSFAIVRQAPPGQPTPYTLGYVDLDDDVRVMAQIDGDPTALRIGMKMALSLRVTGHQDGAELVLYGFEPEIKLEEAR